MTKWVICCLAVINLCTFLVYGWDKICAVKGRWRVKERTLLVLTAAGGSIGALLGMYLFHHKTRKNKFRFGVPAILALHAAIFALALFWLTR